ncbi:hypothetical protein Ccrd_009543 [Cynara cardunculus var. scolymus]|uniref:Uncharacterized protein n=1 Tax=Cynara cardunculus var. scolymus TaxID=59895 RepID=A0A103YMY0_CYNCS|nr:hypothetical protein Ccrd_009543 [Cynara cardunculus var. scolymus]
MQSKTQRITRGLIFLPFVSKKRVE